MPRPWRAILASLAIALTASAVALAWGPGGTARNDSATYLDAARHLARDFTYRSVRTTLESRVGDPVTIWPPGFSALMVPGLWSGLSAVESAQIVLGVCFVLAAWLVYVLALSMVGQRRWWLALLCACSFILIPGELHGLDQVLSDMPAVTVTLAAVYLASTFARRRSRPWWLHAALGVSLCAMVLVRYAALFFVPGILSGTAVSLRGRAPLRDRARQLLPATLVFAATFAPWPLRNYLFANSPPFGERSMNLGDIGDATRDAELGAARWLIDAITQTELIGRAATAAYVAVMVAAAAAVLMMIASRRARMSRGVRLLTAVITSYTLLLVGTAVVHRFDPLSDQRFWLAVWPLGIVLVAAVLTAQGRRGIWLRRAALMGMLFTITVHAVSFAIGLPHARAPQHFLNKGWMRAAAALPPPDQCRLLTSDPRPFMIHRDVGPTSEVPKSLYEFERALRIHRKLCLALLAQDFRRLRRPGDLMWQLKQDRRIELLFYERRARVYRVIR